MIWFIMFSRRCLEGIDALERFVSPRYNRIEPVIPQKKEVPKSKIWYTIKYNSETNDINYEIVN